MTESEVDRLDEFHGTSKSPDTPGHSASDPQTAHWKHRRTLTVLKTLGVDLPTSARVLDFGCGSGETIRTMRGQGYFNVEGYDVAGSSQLSEHRDNITLGTSMDLRLPYPDDSFDLVVSDQVFEHVLDQVTAFSELYRITKPGGHGLHFIPARYMPMEGHIAIPFGGVMQHRWWYKLWALAGFSNQGQKDRQRSSDEIADEDAFFAVEATRYVPTSCYRVVWPRIGFEYRFAEEAFLRGHERPLMRTLGRVGLPVVWLYRTFRSRVVYLHKPVH